MNSLIKYDTARFALQQAVEIDEVKDIRDKAQAMAAYARQANDTKLVEWATEIKVRAERKAGQMLTEMPKNPGNLKNSSRSHDVTTTKLEDLGITKNQSSRWQKLAAVPDDQFEQAVSAAKEVAGEVTTAAMLRIEKQNRPEKTNPKPALNLETDQKLSTGNEENHEEFDEKEQAIIELKDTVISLDEENTRLKDALAAGQLPEDEIQSATEIITELRARIKALEAELDAVKSSRDSYMVENQSLKTQCSMQRKKLKKLGEFSQ